MHRRQFLKHSALKLTAASVATLALPGLSGCFGEQPLHTGVHPWIGYEPLLLARDFGWMPASVEIAFGHTSGRSMAGLQDGSLDAAALTLDEALRVHASGTPLRAVAVTNVSVGADVILARPGIQSLDDLRGRVIGVEMAGVSGVLLFSAMERRGLTRSDVTLLDLPVTEHVAAWQEGRIDVSVCYHPTAGVLEALGAVRLFDSADMPETIFDLLVVTRRAEKRQPDAIGDLVQGYFAGLRHLVRNQYDAVYRIATRQDIAPAMVQQSLALVALPEMTANHRLLAPQGRVELMARQLSELLFREQLVDQKPQFDQFCTRRFLPRGSV